MLQHAVCCAKQFGGEHVGTRQQLTCASHVASAPCMLCAAGSLLSQPVYTSLFPHQVYVRALTPGMLTVLSDLFSFSVRSCAWLNAKNVGLV